MVSKTVRNLYCFGNGYYSVGMIYLSVKEISRKWNNPVRDWGKIIGQFMMFFEERFDEIRTA